MNRTIGLASLGLAALLSGSGAGPAIAGGHRHRHDGPHSAAAIPSTSRSQEPYAGIRHDPYAGYTGPGSEVLNATVRAEREPGVTLELSPDAKETATGGPVGGPPGFDGS